MLTREMVCNHFMQYMFANTKARHVQRVAAWVGFLVAAIEIRKDDWAFRHTRQFVFSVGNDWYKVRYNHAVGTRGGIQIVELADGRTDGNVVKEFKTLDNVEDFYLETLQVAVSKARRRSFTSAASPADDTVQMVTVPEAETV